MKSFSYWVIYLLFQTTCNRFWLNTYDLKYCRFVICLYLSPNFTSLIHLEKYTVLVPWINCGLLWCLSNKILILWMEKTLFILEYVYNSTYLIKVLIIIIIICSMKMKIILNLSTAFSLIYIHVNILLDVDFNDI